MVAPPSSATVSDAEPVPATVADPASQGDAQSETPASTVEPPAVVPLPLSPPAETRDGPWVVNFNSASAYATPDDSAEPITTLRQFTYLQVLGYEEDWARLYNPRTRATLYLKSDVIGPADTPPAYITAAPPEAIETINLPGRIIQGAALAFYPTPELEAYTNSLGHNESVFIVDAVQGSDGSTWYRTSEGDYLPAEAVRLPRAAPRTFGGRWIDADLNQPAMLVAYEDGVPVMSTLTIVGKADWPTPTGQFAIQRRVANETMNSETIGIPRFAPGGYYLTDVLFTQYFLGSGEAIHYNYWSASWGYGASRGCLGLPYTESEFLWRWASVGTPVSVHY